VELFAIFPQVSFIASLFIGRVQTGQRRGHPSASHPFAQQFAADERKVGDMTKLIYRKYHTFKV